ncbi:MAG: mitochondrial fission ELM1 family protein [Hyphomicrobiaceae bacterium]|nr:mitochondrial fission ELM1 family protein [Hyphomicrobiaceae bacterium]
MSDPFHAPHHPLTGRRGWIISDGKAGNDVQARGVFDALGLDIEVKPVSPRGIWYAFSPWIGVSPALRFGAPGSLFAPPWPDFAVSTGRLTIPFLRRLKRQAGHHTFTIVLQDPRTPVSAADLIWVPQHDRRRGGNVITTLTSPHSYTPRRIAELRRHMPEAIARLPAPRVAVALGGPNGDYTYPRASLERLAGALASLGGLGAGLMITPSRRTPAAITAFVREATRELPRIFWDGEGENPYPHFLAHADAFVVPADSVNMTGEPCATGRPVYVFTPEGGSAKFDRFHASLAAHGATRPMPAVFERLETWSYAPVSSADHIAGEIARRWSRRRRGQALHAAHPAS